MSAPETPVQATFRYERKDFEEAQRPLLARQLLLGLGVALPVAFLLGGVFAWWRGGWDLLLAVLRDPALPWTLLAAAAVGGLVAWLWAGWQVRKAYDATPQEDVRVTLGPAGVTFEHAMGHAKLPWEHFTRARETPNLFLLMPHGRLAYVVPKRALAWDGVERVCEMLERRRLLR